MEIVKCDICGSEERIYKQVSVPVYRMHDGNDGKSFYERPQVMFKKMDICEECMRKSTNIYDDTVMGYGQVYIQMNPELKGQKK